MQTYVLELSCETCGGRMRSRIGDMTAAQGDEPVIDIDLAVSQTTFECHSCGAATYLGDLDEICHHEPGTEGGDDD